jgi:hypothetical protein
MNDYKRLHTAADDAYGNRVRILTPYDGRGLTRTEDTFKFFLSSCRITVEQTFGIIVDRFGVYMGRSKMQSDEVDIDDHCLLQAS